MSSFSSRALGAMIAAAGTMLAAAPVLAAPLAMTEPSSRATSQIFEQVMPPQDSADDALAGDSALAPNLRKQIVSYDSREPAGTIVIDTAHTYLYYVLGGGKAIRYGIGVGRQGFTWSGTQAIARKAEWPDWIPPEEMLQRQPYLPRIMAGGPGNPLGARAMYLGSTEYRIHGTNAPDTIGKHVSSGCIRMLNADVIDLYSRAKVGTKVVVLPATSRDAPTAQVSHSRVSVMTIPVSDSLATSRGRDMNGIY